jgi:cation:H+ antiporter
MLANLIPDAFFEQADALLWLYTAGSIVCLVLGADRAVTGGARLAATLGVSKVIIGATVVSLGTTSPEAFVSVLAAVQGKPDLALGNAVGSIICNTALILGLSLLLARLPLDRFVLNRHGWLKLGAAVLLVVVAVTMAVVAGGIEGATVPRAAGVVFLVLLAAYMVISVRWARRHPQPVTLPEEVDLPEEGAKPAKRRHPAWAVGWNLFLCVAGLGLVAAASQVLIGSVSTICTRHGVPPDILAVIVVAFGTSLPELVTAIASIAKGHPEVLVGNVIGADVLNVLFVVGASASAAGPLEVAPFFFYLHFPVMLLAVGLVRVYIWTSGTQFKRWHGLPLLGLFVAYYTVLALVAKGPLPGLE